MPINVSSPLATKSSVYSNFLGVDFSQDPLLVDKRRSPYSVNMISDTSGLPEKRAGYKTLFSLPSPVYSIANGVINSQQVFLAHCQDKLYRFDGESAELLYSGLLQETSSIFFTYHNGKTKAFILTGREYLVYDLETVKKVEDIAYIPTILIARSPTGGGTPYEEVNLLQKKRREKFLSTSSKTYQLSANNLDSDTINVVLLKSTGETQLTEGTDFTVNRSTGLVSFTQAVPETPVAGTDNIYITYSKTVSGYKERIKGCKVSSYFGIGSDGRIFLTGNKEYPAYDWFCSSNDPTYFGDLNYSIVGSSNNAIMGYGKIGQYLIVIKEDNNQDTTIFLRTVSKDEQGKTVFLINGCITGLGAISPHSFAQLVDEPLFLSSTGIYAVTSNTITAEKTLQNRSFYIDNKLCKEENLNKAVAHAWNGYYVIALNGNVYLLDSRQKSVVSQNSFVYECYFWDKIHATCFMTHNNLLYFGDKNGKICVFKTDMQSMEKYSDDGEAITAIWSTKMDDDGMGIMTKNLNKKGCLVTLKPYERSGVKISVKSDKDTEEKLILNHPCGIWSFTNIYFDSFSFLDNFNARAIVFKHKVKKYASLQFILKNDEINQGFGIFNLIKCYTPINYIKR